MMNAFLGLPAHVRKRLATALDAEEYARFSLP
jgi:hypothetical protein